MSSDTAAWRLGVARTREYDWTGQRVFLNAASYGPLPRCTLDALAAFDRHRHTADLSDREITAAMSAARTNAAALVGGDAAEIALAPNTTTGVNNGAEIALGRAAHDPRRAIVVSHGEFPANVFPWMALEQHGFELRLIPTRPDGLPDEQRIAQEIQRPDVAVLAVSYVQFATGYRADLAALGEICRTRDILFVVDAIQGIGVVPIDVHDCGIDVLACGAQKWLCSPWGTGFTYIRRALMQQFEPILPGWLAFASSADYSRMVQYRYEMFDDGRRFEGGTLPYQSFVGFNQSVGVMLDLGIAEIWQHLCALQDQMAEWCGHRGVAIVSDRSAAHRSGIFCMRPANPAAVHARLAEERFTCSIREGAIRLSPHFYNTHDEIDQLLRILDQVA